MSFCNALLAVSVAQQVAREFALDLQPGLGAVTALALASTSHPLHDQELHVSCHPLKGLLQLSAGGAAWSKIQNCLI